MMRLTVRLKGPPSSPLSTSTPGPIARHAWSITDRRGWPIAMAVATCESVLISAQDRGIPKLRQPKKLGSVAGRRVQPGRMKKLTMPLAGAGVGLIATAVAVPRFSANCSITVHQVGPSWPSRWLLVGRLVFLRSQVAAGRTVGVGTVRDRHRRAAVERQQSSSRWSPCRGRRSSANWRAVSDDPDVSLLRPGLVVLVALIPLPAKSFRCPTTSWPCARRGWPRCESVSARRRRRK